MTVKIVDIHPLDSFHNNLENLMGLEFEPISIRPTWEPDSSVIQEAVGFRPCTLLYVGDSEVELVSESTGDTFMLTPQRSLNFFAAKIENVEEDK